MAREGKQRLALALALTAVLGGVLVAAAGVLAALPALLAFLPLLAGRYVGAERLERLIAARIGNRGPGRAASPGLRPRRHLPRIAVPRGGGLLASSLAKRPPPAFLTA